MGYKTEAKNAMLDHLATLITHVSLHSAYPASGANEISGGGYARQPIAFDSASGGVLSANVQPEFDVPAGATVAAVGFWSAAANGTLLADADVTDETYANAGTYRIDTADLDLNAV